MEETEVGELHYSSNGRCDGGFQDIRQESEEIGERQKFSFNKNRLVISVRLDKYQRISRAKHKISNVFEEDNVLRCIAEHYRKCRKIYEASFVDLRKEIMEIDSRLLQVFLCGFCSQTNCQTTEENVGYATNYLPNRNGL